MDLNQIMSEPQPDDDDLVDRLLAFSATLANEEEDLVNEAAKQLHKLQERNRGLEEQVKLLSPDDIAAGRVLRGHKRPDCLCRFCKLERITLNVKQ